METQRLPPWATVHTGPGPDTGLPAAGPWAYSEDTGGGNYIYEGSDDNQRGLELEGFGLALVSPLSVAMASSSSSISKFSTL
jgi:hypothetical protein